MELRLIEDYVKQILADEATGHDLQHIERVLDNAMRIARAEGVSDERELALIQAAVWLHDVVDDKVVADVEQATAQVQYLLQQAQATPEEQAEILYIIAHQSFSKNLAQRHPLSRAGQIVQDADRLDATGAISIARTFYYGGARGHALYNELPVRDVQTLSLAEYRQNQSVIGHFYEKLFKIKELMNTETGRRLAQERTQFMELFVEQFWDEVKGRK